MKSKIIKGAVFSFVGLLAIMGIIFTTLLAHEYTHVLQSKSPTSICYDMQQQSFMHVKHDITAYQTIENFKEFATFSEKSARIVEQLVGYLTAILAGIGMTYVLMKK